MASVQSSLGGNSYPDPEQSQYDVVFIDCYGEPLAFAHNETFALQGYDNLVAQGFPDEAMSIRRGFLN